MLPGELFGEENEELEDEYFEHDYEDEEQLFGIL